ncbi:MAG: hypothetical protein ACREXS_03165 [Gammaproteobacteria bacterium]
MRAMKLIVSHLEALRTYVSREFYYIMRDLISTHGWRHLEICKLWNGAGTIRDKLIDEFGELPESILFWEGYELLHAQARDIYRLDCRKFVLADDLHWRDERMRQRKLVSFALCDTILSTYGYTWARFYPEFSGTKKVVWIPHSASPDFMLPYNRCPENSILLSGAISRYYPLRQQMKALHAQGPTLLPTMAIQDITPDMTTKTIRILAAGMPKQLISIGQLLRTASHLNM